MYSANGCLYKHQTQSVKGEYSGNGRRLLTGALLIAQRMEMTFYGLSVVKI